MITHARGNYRAGRQGDGTARRPCHLQPRASSPALGAERRRRHAGACRHVVSSGRRPIDSAFPYPRFGRGALATQAGGGSVRTSEHPLLSVRRAENRLAPRYPFPGEHSALLLRPSHAQRRRRLGGICGSPASRRARAPRHLRLHAHVGARGVSRHRPVGTDCCWRTCC